MNEYLYGLTEGITSEDVSYSDEPIDRGDALVATALASVAQELRTANKIARLDMLFRYMDAGDGGDRRIVAQAEGLDAQLRDELSEEVPSDE